MLYVKLGVESDIFLSENSRETGQCYMPTLQSFALNLSVSTGKKEVPTQSSSSHNFCHTLGGACALASPEIRQGVGAGLGQPRQHPGNCGCVNLWRAGRFWSLKFQWRWRRLSGNGKAGCEDVAEACSLQPQRTLGTGLQGGENGGGHRLLFLGLQGPGWRILTMKIASRPCVFRVFVCVRMSVWVYWCLARSPQAHPECAHRGQALVHRAGSWGVPYCSYQGICSLAGDRLLRVLGDGEGHFSRLNGHEDFIRRGRWNEF